MGSILLVYAIYNWATPQKKVSQQQPFAIAQKPSFTNSYFGMFPICNLVNVAFSYWITYWNQNVSKAYKNFVDFKRFLARRRLYAREKVPIRKSAALSWVLKSHHTTQLACTHAFYLEELPPYYSRVPFNTATTSSTSPQFSSTV